MSDWQIDKPQAGYYATRLVRNGPLVAVHIWYGAPPDPEDPRKLLDRSHRWQCLVDGCEADPWETWPRVAGRTITEGEYRRLLGAKKWDRIYAPDSPTQKPDKPVNWSKLRLPGRRARTK